MANSKEKTCCSFGGSPNNKLQPEQALEIWKPFANTGGADKDRMVTITTSLLAISGSIMGYVATEFLKEEHLPFVVLAFIAGMSFFVSMLGMFIVLLYASYTNWNWAKADMIARQYGLKEMLPEKGDIKLKWNILNWFSRPRDPQKELAPVF